MLLKSLLLGASLPMTVVHVAAFNCASFWPSVKPGQSNTLDANCQMYPGYPQTIGTTKVTVVYTDEWKGNLGIIDELLNEAIVESIAIYSTLTTPPDMVIILGAGDAPKKSNAALDTYMPSSNGPCQIRTFRWWAANAGTEMSPVAMQSVAHEIYHCVQGSILGNGPKDTPTNWVIEASADYFSNIVFPYADGEVDREITYQPGVPIWKQERYVPALWFQSLEWARGIVYLHDFVMSTTFAASDDGERARLSAIPGFIDDFYLFALQFSLNHIYDTNGKLDPIQNPPEYNNVVWSVNDDATEGTAELETVPFTISGFRLQFEAGQNVKIYSSATSNQRIAWRRKGETVWNEIPNFGSSGGSEGVIELPCASGPQRISVLVISTENKASDKVKLHYVQQYKDDNCCRKDPKKRDSAECPAGSTSTATSSAPEPTHTSSGPSSGSCSGSSIPMDPCLTSHSWSLDIPSTRELMKKQLSKLQSITITDVQVSGAGGLDFDKKNVTFTYTELKTSVSVKAEGLKDPISVIIDGDASGRFFIKSGGSGSGTACLAYTSGKGTAKAVLPILGDQTFDLAPGGGYLKNMDIDYTCSNGRVTISSSGSENALTSGGPSWGPFSYNDS
ncbi:hypothetical protein G7Z17_g9147 [Cylindrodendrum hubeiense]|uniref:Uncharacterized protein n=1 Tax=Cylindrodendrum hubeiense TaxID=595255 RepID=A0A9P5H5M2_9HYPO|nr:hypothetical protein G7Z17_g9147 [Cylindrodendrum hubeiense]